MTDKTAELANNAVEYEDAAYVEGVRDLARMIEESGTANWKAVVGVLNDCAGMIELRTRERDALDRPKPAVPADGLREALRQAGRKLMSVEDAVPAAKEAQKIILAALSEAPRSCCEAEREAEEALTERLRQAIEGEANRQPATWDWYDLARAAATAIRGAD